MGSCCSIADNEEEKLKGGEEERGLAAAIERACEFLEKWPFLIAAGLSLVASFALSHGGHCHEASRLGLSDPAMISVLICGLPLLREAVVALFVKRAIRTSLLITVAMISCLSIGQIFAAGEVAFLMALGETLELATLKRARRGLSKLVSLVPPTARYVVTCPKCKAKGIFFKDLPLAEINVGDGVKVLPGETIPVDGVIAEGSTTVDQSVMTGESMPVDKGVGDEVYSGTVNRFGSIVVKVTKADADSSLQKMIRLVKEAQAKKAPVQRIADKWASILVPAALCVAVLTFLGVWAWYAWGYGAVPEGSTAFMTGLVRGVTIMVVFCPCSLALATPTAIMAAIGQATKYGVIVKSGEAMERMGRVNVACLDKTGTLTEGRLAVSSVVPLGGMSADELLALAASAESSSEHPLARAIAAAATASSASGFASSPASFRMTPGMGVAAEVDGRAVLCGTAAWLSGNGVELSGSATEAADKVRGEGKAVVFVAVDGRAAGFIALADVVRPGAKEAVADLAAAGVRPCLMTGDHAATARFVARDLGIDDVRAEMLPSDKAKVVEEIEAGGAVACMVGDGVNDAVALKTASVGIAMGGVGSDIAVEAADIALVGDDIGKLAYLKRLSNACVGLIRFNICLSMGINAVAIVCSILGILSPVTGALVHNCGSVFVVMNAALLYDRKFR